MLFASLNDKFVEFEMFFFFLDVTGNTRFLSMHIYCVANDYCGLYYILITAGFYVNFIRP